MSKKKSAWDNLPEMVIETMAPSKVTGLGPKNRKVENLAAIVQVNKARYVPKGFTVRGWIDDTMYTANVTRAALTAIETDDNVKSVGVSDPLQAPKTKLSRRRRFSASV